MRSRSIPFGIVFPAAVILFVFPVLSSFANDGAYIQSAKPGVFVPIANDGIEMVAEEIVIDVDYSDESNYAQMIFLNRYLCTFRFTNTTDKEINVPMGFPFKKSRYNDRLDGKSIIDFTVTADGKIVPFIMGKHGVSQDFPDLNYDEVYIFNITFKPRETKTVVNSFSIVDIGSESSPPLTSGPYHVEYIMKSGRTWRKPIRKATVTINFNFPAVFFGAFQASPADYEIDKGEEYSFTYRFENLTPAHDIELVYDLRAPDNYTAGDIARLTAEFREKREYQWLGMFANSVTKFWIRPDHKLDDELYSVYFWAAHHFYLKKDYFTSCGYYFTALGHALRVRHSSKMEPDFFGDFNLLQELRRLQAKDWENGGEKNTPAYNCVYNIACCHALAAAGRAPDDRQPDIKSAFEWLIEAKRIDPRQTKALMEKDKDLELLKKSDPARFRGILKD